MVLKLNVLLNILHMKDYDAILRAMSPEQHEAIDRMFRNNIQCYIDGVLSNTGEEYSTFIGKMFRDAGIKVSVESKVKSYVSHQKENINIFINF